MFNKSEDFKLTNQVTSDTENDMQLASYSSFPWKGALWRLIDVSE